MAIKKEVFYGGKKVDLNTLSAEEAAKVEHVCHLDKIKKRVAHQFFVDRKSVEFLAKAFEVSKANILYCITELSQEFGEAIVINRHNNRYHNR